MNCEELRQHYDLYALGIAEDPEGSEIRVHLNRGCEVCMAGVKRALETAALIGATAPEAQPSRNLRRRILASVGSRPARLSWAPAFAVAALFLLAAAFFAASMRHRTEEQSAAFAILSGPRTKEVSFGQGKVFVNPTRGVLLIASNLPRTAADKVYEMWIIPKGAKPVPAGLFQSQNDGSAMHVRPGTVDMASTAAVAVTIENQAGADQPTTTPLIVANLTP